MVVCTGQVVLLCALAVQELWRWVGGRASRAGAGLRRASGGGLAGVSVSLIVSHGFLVFSYPHLTVKGALGASLGFQGLGIGAFVDM